MPTKLQLILDTVLSLAAGLLPGALGAIVSLLYEKGLTWGDRFTQFSVGVIVSYFAGNVVRVLWPADWFGALDPFVLQGITFTLGMIAFKATPRLASTLVERMIDGLHGALDRFLPKRKDGQ